MKIRQKKIKEIMETIEIALDEICSPSKCPNCEKCYYDMLLDGRINIFGIGMFTPEDNIINCEVSDEDREYVKNMLEKLTKKEEVK